MADDSSCLSACQYENHQAEGIVGASSSCCKVWGLVSESKERGFEIPLYLLQLLSKDTSQVKSSLVVHGILKVVYALLEKHEYTVMCLTK